MIRQNEGNVRIAIAGRYLDEVQIRLARSQDPGTVSYLSYPAHRHRARAEEDRVTVSTQTATAVALFADGVLPPIGGGAVTVEIDGLEIGPCFLETVEAGDTNPSGNAIILNFHRMDEGSR